MSKLRIDELLIVEGKYDAVALANMVDGLIITTDGFSIFSDKEKKELIREVGKKRGIILLTDSDSAGFQIRHYIEKIASNCSIKHAYIPFVNGKESRKAKPSKEGALGVEGMPQEVLLHALERAGVVQATQKHGRPITYTDLFELGLSGGADSSSRRRELLQRIGLPQRLSKKALCEVLSSLYTYEEFLEIVENKPVLFWDFHGTLTLPAVQWFDVAMEAAKEKVPEYPLDEQILKRYFSATCLPWFTIENGDTRHLIGQETWWAYCETEFIAMFQNCGFSLQQAKKIAPELRKKIVEPHRYTLFEDAIPTLQQLQRRGYRHYIASNNFPELERVLEALGLRPYFSGVVVSALIGYEKPNTCFFDTVLAVAGKPETAWMIGDNPIDDIDGGKKAGLTTVLVHTGEQVKQADFTVKDLEELLALLP